MSVLVNIFASSYHRVIMYVPIDSVSSHGASRYVGCAVKISNRGVMSEFLCSNAFFCSWLIQRLSVCFVGLKKKKKKKIS